MFGITGSKHQPFATTALEALAAHVMIADENLTIVYVNPALSKLLGQVEEDLRKELPRFSMSTLVGSNIDVFHARPNHQRSLLKGLSQPHSATIRVGQLMFDLRVVPLSAGRKRKGFVVEWADARERLLNLDYSAQIAAIGRSQAVVAFTAEGTILSANANFLSVMGYSMEEIQGQHHRLFVEAEVRNSPEYGTFWNELRQGHAPSGEYRRVAKGGRLVWVQGSYNPILDERGRVTKVVKFITDVTPRIRSVADVGAALAALSQGDLERRIDRALIPELDKLRLDFNVAADTLQKTMLQVGQATEAIHGGSGEIRAHSNDLARRTEQQAASLEETAAALDEITATVKATAGGATNARAAVERAKSDAEHSGAVVAQAIEAMTAIETSSRQISQIIGVIDEIAFQTNLLALNAGVEAARAGDAGRGFAVVASEVRALAQRSAEAAKEIKTLILTSTEQVSAGVGLVGETGRTLKRIVTQVTEINAIVSDIAASAREQASGLSEVNTAINQMDQVTQQNAAMVEESTAASHSLATETERLARLIGQFKIGSAAPPRTLAPANPNQSMRRPALKVMGRGGAARKIEREPVAADAGWEEF